MRLKKTTKSFCSTCFLEIPATITAEADGAWMTKSCPTHGETRAMVERNSLFYTYVNGLNAQMIYPGMFVDVTLRCNLRCNPCFQALLKEDPAGQFTMEKILNECRVNMDNAPIILTGGEPTLREDIVELLTEIRAISPPQATPRMLSNGVRLAKDRTLYEKVLYQLRDNTHGFFGLNLSIHHKESDEWKTLLHWAREDKIKFESILVVIDSKESFLAAVALAHEWSDVIGAMRIHVGTSLYADQQQAMGENKIFVSDMLKWLEEAGEDPQEILPTHNKVTFYNVRSGITRVWLMLVSWFDVTNIDLIDIDVPPRYRANNGAVYNLVTWGVVNGGMANGYLYGKKIQPIK